ncbi:hypothetical protein NEOLEDRAFT_1045443, partial [Neolentinus lepideus HHB14362 ss-1]
LGTLQQHIVYSGEGVGVILALELRRKEQHLEGTISIGLDNMAVLQALPTRKVRPGYHILQHIRNQVQRLIDHHKDLKIVLRWVPCHKDLEGNELTDKEAKHAAKGKTSATHLLPQIL